MRAAGWVRISGNGCRWGERCEAARRMNIPFQRLNAIVKARRA
jgi:hypothetical protein